ncbi:hypothetical protein BH23BAC1_BH23BAC1_21130 [soil metagenome]
MKIIWIAYDRQKYLGGPIINTIRVLPEFVLRGHDVWALIGHDGSGHPSTDILEKKGVKCIPYKINYYSEDDVKFILLQISIIQPDVFISNISTPGAFAGYWIKKWGIPVIHSQRGDDALNNGAATYFFNGPKKWRLDGLMSVNPFLLKKVLPNHNEKIITKIIPSGVPVPNFKKNINLTKELRIIYSGRFVQRIKRIQDILSVFVSLANQNPYLYFTFLGSGDLLLLEEMKQQVLDQQLENRIFFKETLLGEAYKEELCLHDVIVLLSESEGTPGSILDGMSCGLVPIVYNTYGIEFLIKDKINGFIVNDRREHFMNTILSLQKDKKKREDIGIEARNTIIENFSLSKTTDLWEEFFIEIHAYKKYKGKFKIPKIIKLPKNNKLLVQHICKPDILEKINFFIRRNDKIPYLKEKLKNL